MFKGPACSRGLYETPPVRAAAAPPRPAPPRGSGPIAGGVGRGPGLRLAEPPLQGGRGGNRQGCGDGGDGDGAAAGPG